MEQSFSPDRGATPGGRNPASTQRSEGRGQPPDDFVKDSLEASHDLKDSLDLEQSQQLKDSLDFDSGRNSPVTGRKTYPVESPTSNKVPNISTASAHSRRRENPNALSQIRPDSELSRGIPTPKPSSGVPDSAKGRVPGTTARPDAPTTGRSTSSVYAVANPAILAAQGDTPREGTQNTKFTPRAEQAVQRRGTTQESVKPVEKRENTQGSVKPVEKRENTQGSVKPAEKRENTQGSVKPAEKRENTQGSVKPAEKRENTQGSVKPAEKRENTQGSVKPLEKRDSSPDSVVLERRQDSSRSVRSLVNGVNSAKGRVDSVQSNAQINSAKSGRKSGRSAVSFQPEPKNKSESDSDDEIVRAQSHLKERVPTPHPRSPLKSDQVTPRRDTSQIKDWDSDQSDSETPKPASVVPQREVRGPSPVVQERRSANAANTTLPTVKRVYVDSPTFTQEEEDQYRFVESRLEDGNDNLEDTFRKLDKDDKNIKGEMATTTQAPPIQGGHLGYARDGYDTGAYNNQYSRPPPEPQYRDNYQSYGRNESGQGAPHGGQYSRKDSEGPGVPISDQYSRNNNQGQRPQGRDSQYSQQSQNKGYPQDLRGGRDNQDDPRGPPPPRDIRQDNRYEDRNIVMNQKVQGHDDRYEDRNTGYNRYEDRNREPLQYEGRNDQPPFDDRNQQRYEDRNEYNSYQNNRGDRGPDDRNEPPQYRDNRQEAPRYEDRNRYDDRNVYNGRNEPEQYDQPRSLIQNGYQQDEDDDQLMKQEAEYQAHLQQRLRTQAQHDEEFVIPKLPLEDSLEEPWQNPPPPPPQAYQDPRPYGFDEREAERMEVVNPPPVKYDFVENNKMDYGKVPEKSYAFILERKKEGESKLDSVFITPKVKKKATHNNATANKSRPDSPRDDYIPSENASTAEALWAKRSTALERKKDGKQSTKSKTASGTSLRKNRGLQKYPSENGLIRQPLYSQGQNQGRQPVHMYGTPTRNHYLEPLENKQQRTKPSDRMDSQAMPPQSFKPIDLKPVTKEIVTEDGQRISVDINLKVLSPRGEGGDPRGIPQVSAEVLHGSQATGGARPVGTQYYPGAYEGQDQDQYRQQYYQPPPGPPQGAPHGAPPRLPPGLPPSEPYNFDYSQAPDQESQLPPQTNQDYSEPQYQPPETHPYQQQGSPPYQQQGSPRYQQQSYQTQPQQPPLPPEPPAHQSPQQYQRAPSYDRQSHPAYEQPHSGYEKSYEVELKNRSPNPYPKIPPISAGTSERNVSGPIRVELQGYSLIHQKNRNKDPNEQPWYPVYTLSDYKKLKKELEANRPGPLGPDLDSETHMEKVMKKSKQNEYGRLVMERNRQELLDRKPVRRQPVTNEQREENKRRTVSQSLVYDSYLDTPMSDMPSKLIHKALNSTSAPGRLAKSRPRGEANRRKLALDYAKNVPKPVVKAKPSQYNSYEVSSQLSPHNKKGNQSPVKVQTPVEVVDLQKLQRRHEEEKQNVAMIKQNIPQKV
ncbi:zinc finger CCCH domain-containing protein 13-like isoform X2 [Argopecten irradians]|uniref:zinc finger CCCH domain-containing protein 13-like isoform X2 n=1 Tax=Argopecten irradians TaxID=31199 RepID=UPI003715FDE4